MKEGSSGCGCMKGCGIGCGSLVLVAIGLTVLTTIGVVAPFDRAVETRAELEEHFGDQKSYRPASDGVPTEDRLRAFIRVRDSLGPACDKISDIAEQMHKMEQFDGRDDISKVEIMSQAMRTTQAAIMMAPALADFFEARNTALLEAEMGLGEYTYIYVLAYHDQLGDNFTDDGIFDGQSINTRIHHALLDMLKAQRDTFTGSAEAPQFLTALDEEIAAMSGDNSRIPWQDGLPTRIADALEPYRVELNQLFCEDATAIELQRNRKRFLTIISE